MKHETQGSAASAQLRYRNVAIVVSTQGFHWEELAAAVQVFQAAKLRVAFFTTNGRAPMAEAKSLKSHGRDSELSIDSDFGKKLALGLKSYRPILELNPLDYWGLYLAGGYGCLNDVNTSPALHARILEFYQSGKPLGAIGHATSTLAFVEQRGIPIVEGRRLTGFPKALEDILISLSAIPTQYLPLPLSNEAKLQMAGAKNPFSQRVVSLVDPYFTVKDPPFFTGVGPKAAKSVALAMLLDGTKAYVSKYESMGMAQAIALGPEL